MNIILIFTNWDSIYRNLSYFDLKWCPDNKKPCEIIPVNERAYVIVAFDAMENIDELADKVAAIAPAHSISLSVLYHKNPSGTDLASFNSALEKKEINYHFRKSHHGDPDTFGRLIDIDANLDNPQALEKTFYDLELKLGVNASLSQKLKLLHKCTSLEQAVKLSLDPLLAEYSQALEDFQLDLKPENHDVKLTALRDILLSSL